MADYYAKTRSNYFKVKDEDAFREWADDRESEVWEKEIDGETYFAISSTDVDAQGWCRVGYNEEEDETYEVDFEQELSTHLQDGSVAVLMETGAESLWYLFGQAIALNNKGETVTINLWDVYAAAKRLGKGITRAEY